MIDPVTEQILMEAQVLDRASKIASMIQSALKRKDKTMLNKMSKQLPKKKKLSELEKEAARRFPNFRENYKKAQRAVVQSREAKGIERPVAFVTAIATTVTAKPTSEIIDKLSQASAMAQKEILFPGDIMAIKLTLFIIFVILVFATEGAIIGVMWKGVVWCVAGLFSLMGVALEAAKDPSGAAKDAAWSLF